MDKALAAKIAAAAAQPDNVLMATESTMQQAAEKAQAIAESRGVPIYIRTSARLDDGSRLWPTTLAGTLCEAPALARGTRQDMADIITSTMGLGKPFNPTRLSQELSQDAKKHVGLIFREYGYGGVELGKGISIRDTVRRGKDMQDVCEIKREISTKFYADRVVIDGTTFRYKQRERVALGQPWNDFALRMRVDAAGVDVPLLYLLKMRGISLGEFISADEAARAQASGEELEKRATLDRESDGNQRKVTLLRALEQSAETTDNKAGDIGPWFPRVPRIDCTQEAGRTIEPVHPGITDPDELDEWILRQARESALSDVKRQSSGAETPVE